MIRLPNSGTYSLELITAQNGANVVVSWSDATSTTYTGGTTATSITSATTTTICATPAASTVRDIDEILIKNTYAGSHSITVQLDVATTNIPLITVALLTNESLNYTHGSGWQCLDANGNVKLSPLTAMTSAQLASIISDEQGSGALVFATSPTLTTPTIGVATATSINKWAFTAPTTAATLTAGGDSLTYTLPPITSTLGYRNLPAVGTKTGSYTLAVGDVGKYVQLGTSGAITIPDATFSEGDAISLFNNTTGNITITCTITTAYIAGTDSDKATMTLATRGVCTILFISGTVCVVSGNVT